MKTLILGAGGFIGSHLTLRLLNEGHDVVGMDIYNDKLRELLDHERLCFIQQDIRNPNAHIDEYVKDSDLIIDLIAYANPGLYLRMPLEVFRLNFTENLKIVESCVKHKKRIIQFSTCEVYGRTVVSAVSERLENPEDPSYATFSEDTSLFILGPVQKHPADGIPPL